MTCCLNFAGRNQVTADDRPIGNGGGELGGLGLGKDFVQENVVEVLTGCSEPDFAEDLRSFCEVFPFFAIRSRVGQLCDHGAYGDEFAETRSHFFLGFFPTLDFFNG